jgi:small-conductance mechanosensitive channel/CRP-like cAMP-binding protein
MPLSTVDISNDYLGQYVANPWIIAAILIALFAYRLLAFRLPRLPHIPLGLIIAYLVLHLALIILPPGAQPELVHWLSIAATITFFCAAFRVAFALTVEFSFRVRKSGSFPKITRDFILFTAYAIVVFVVLRTRGDVNLVGLVTTSAVLTAVIGLAAQNTLGNLFAGLALQLERPYGIYDWIQFGETVGQVVGIGWKSTRLKTFEDELVFVPNMDIAKSLLKNFSRPSRRHVMKVDIGLDYDAPPNRVREALLEALRQEPRVHWDPPPQIRTLGYNDFTITYQLRFCYDDFGVSPDLRAAVLKELWYALRRHRIHIPYPIRDVRHHHVERRIDLARRDEERQSARADLDAVPILGDLSPAERDQIAARMLVLDYGDGEAIVRQGEAGASMFILHRGACEVFVRKGDAPPVSLATLTPPSFFGEMSLLTGEPRSATVSAKGDSRLFAIDRELFGKLLAANPAISERLARTLAARQAGTAEAIDKLGLDADAQASKMLKLIKSFFGIA